MSDDPGPPATPAPEATMREMRQTARQILAQALAECGIAKAFARHMQYAGGLLRIGDDSYDLGSFERVLVVSIGKAGHAMVKALAAITGAGPTGIVACPLVPDAEVPGFRYYRGGHPLPNAESLRAGDAILKLLGMPSEHILVI